MSEKVKLALIDRDNMETEYRREAIDRMIQRLKREGYLVISTQDGVFDVEYSEPLDNRLFYPEPTSIDKMELHTTAVVYVPRDQVELAKNLPHLDSSGLHVKLNVRAAVKAIEGTDKSNQPFPPGYDMIKELLDAAADAGAEGVEFRQEV